MPVAPTQTLVVQDGDETTPVVPIPVRLVTENGKPFQPDSGTTTVANVTDASELGKQLMKATDAANARTLIGAGTGNCTVANITDATDTGRQLMKATDAANARSLIGAGTSNYTKPESAAAITDLAGAAEVAEVVTAFNKVLAALRSWGIIAS